MHIEEHSKNRVEYYSYGLRKILISTRRDPDPVFSHPRQFFITLWSSACRVTTLIINNNRTVRTRADRRNVIDDVVAVTLASQSR